MKNFVYTGNPARVIFGQGTVAALPDEADRLKVRRILVLSTPEQADQAAEIAGSLGQRVVASYSKAQMHTPVDVTADAMRSIERHDVDALLSVGGGSTTGLGKAIALRTDLPQIVVPTTYAGSEATPILGETEGGRKVTKSDPRILPEVIVYDVNLTLTLPVPLSVTSGFNAVAHAVEALYAKEANPIISLAAEEGISAIVRAMPRIHANREDIEGRSSALYGAWLCGVCLGSVGMALHHKLCHTLGGMFNLPHAQLHTAMLPHALAYNAPATPVAMERLKRSLTAPDPAKFLYDMAKELGAVMSLRDLGMPEGSIEAAVEQALSNAYWNPRELERSGLHRLLDRAFRGDEPKTE
ncbi:MULTISPECIES: maleylacetate reductase [unclassified Rhizobium]|uniref:maleylacetate reductase n=1 Tax=unclassified Rhizobium TaxID=2613769 RepID=UPI00160F7E2E|nr:MULTISPECIES: maleylacetate reductase [unclassified Rhizobium]MBB3320364.1 alcohol dehydrogenase class IV [Rhizobium sp. BK181]MBB3543030.1 alcohol dehydrogenase class IV [Rhizobium sp. BK399]MCS3742247.1 alcohol dehydrogenase class IV [Rhizobium sp. BK661]MCS4096269.1 alcohol dehydrogenase class IV [Rhizobium sp. BK176]